MRRFILLLTAVVSLYLSENIDNGKQIQLSDGSTYEIAPDDVIRSALWIFPLPIEIQASDDPDYPIKLINSNLGSSVKAKRLP